MSIEQLIAENTATLRELINTIKAQGTKQANTEAPNSEVTDIKVPDEVKTDPPVEEVPAISEEEMMTFLRQIIDIKGAGTVSQIFKSFGKNRLSDFDSSQYPELKARLET